MEHNEPHDERIIEIETERLREFNGHPFKVTEDRQMAELMESIGQYGILTPLVVRPVPDGVYEIISGHRRMHAASLLEMERIPAIIREMTDDEAVVKMVDSNIQREELLPSEKAFAYKMKMEAMRRQAGRPSKDNPRQNVGNYETADKVGKENGESGRQVQRYIRLTELIPELLDYVDQKRIQFTVAVEISYIDPEVQKWLYEYIKDNGAVKLNQVSLLRDQLQSGAITQSKMITLLNESQPGKKPSSKLTFTEKKLREFFPVDYSPVQMRKVIEELLAEWKRNQEEQEET